MIYMILLIYFFCYCFIEIIYLSRYSHYDKKMPKTVWEYDPFINDLIPFKTDLKVHQWLLHIIFLPLIAFIVFIEWFFEK